MYIQPIYLQAQEQGGFPEFRRVVVVFGDSIEWAPSLDEALAEVFGLDEPGDSSPPTGEEPSDEEPEDAVPQSVQELLDQAASLLNQADEALRAGDLGTYQELIDQARDLIEQARQAGTEASARRFVETGAPSLSPS